MIIAIIAVCSIVSFFYCKKYGETNIFMVIISIIGFPGMIIGFCVRDYQAKRSTKEDIERREKKEEEKKNRINEISERIRLSPKTSEIARRLAAIRPLPQEILIGTERAGEITYHSIGMQNIPEECCQAMAKALSETKELKDLYEVKDLSSYEYGLAIITDYRLVLIKNSFAYSEW